MGNQQSDFFVYSSAVDGHEYNYHPDYNQTTLFAEKVVFLSGWMDIHPDG